MKRALIIMMLMLLAPLVVADEAGSNITRVVLRSTVRLQHDDQHLTLGELARINGPQADTLKALAIDPRKPIEAGVWSQIETSDIREQLKEASGINFGAIMLSGPDIRITRLMPIPARPTPAVEHNTEPQQSTQSTLQQQVERWLLARLKTKPEKTRMRFDDRDKTILSTATTNHIVEIREIGRSERMVIGIVVYEHERVVIEQSIKVEVLIEQPVRIADEQIKRRSTISDENTHIEQRWLPVTSTHADPIDALGQVCNSTIAPGKVVLSSMLEAPVLVARGQIVNARSIAGSVSVSLMVRAKQSGKLGDIIELESRDRTQQFQARVAGRGRVVIIHKPQYPITRSQPEPRAGGSSS